MHITIIFFGLLTSSLPLRDVIDVSLYGYLLSEHLEKSRIKFWNVSLSFFLLQSPTSWNTSWQTFSIIIVKHFQNCLDELFVPFYPFLWSVTFSKEQLLNLLIIGQGLLKYNYKSPDISLHLHYYGIIHLNACYIYIFLKNYGF